MKVIPALMAMAVSSLAAPSDPGETAVHFLEKVRNRKLNLEPGTDTALSPHTSETKREEISRRLDRMVRDLGNDPLEVGAVKLDGDLAAVLVRKIGGFDPNRMRVFPIALVRRGAEWSAAPVPASFENSGIGYAAALRDRLKTLEDWMLREQVVDLAKLQDQSADRMRRKIEETLSAATLRTLDSSRTVDRFVAFCQERNLPGMFGLLGGLSAGFPEDWPDRVKAAERVIAAGPDVKNPWRQLISHDVLRAVVHREEDERSALVSIACLDPATLPLRVRLVHLPLSKSADRLWRVDLPDHFLNDQATPDDETDDALDSDLLAAFPARLAESQPATPQSTAVVLRQAVIDALQDGAISSLIPLIRLEEDSPLAVDSYTRAARLWWAMREPSSLRRAVPLDIVEREETAAATVQIFSASHPDRMDLRVLIFEKSAAGWLWTPSPAPETERSFQEWIELQSGRWQDRWQEELLSECLALEKLPADGSPPPTEEEARKLVDFWFQAIKAGDLSAALRLTARLKLPDSKPTLFRNLGYELNAARNDPRVPDVTAVHRGALWAAVGTRFSSHGKSTFPLYPTIMTPAGPRIVPEIDLSVSDLRSRDFLNKSSLQRLADADPEAADELRKLLGEHRRAVLKNGP